MCGRHHDIIDGDEQAYSVDRLTKMKADHEARSGQMDDKLAERGARHLLHQPVISVNQSGGITAHTINVSIGPPRRVKQSSFHRLVVDIENIAAARFMLQGSRVNGNVGMIFYNIRVVNSSPENITINEVILRYRSRDRQFSTQSHVLVTGTVWSPADKEDVDSIVMHLGLNNIIMMNWHNLRVVAGKHPLISPGGVMAGSAAFIFDFQDPAYLSTIRKLEIEITDYAGYKTRKSIPLNKQWVDQARRQTVSNRAFAIGGMERYSIYLNVTLSALDYQFGSCTIIGSTLPKQAVARLSQMTEMGHRTKPLSR